MAAGKPGAGAGCAATSSRRGAEGRCRAVLLAIGTGLLAGGCASTPPGPPVPVVSPTGIVYDLGTPPTETRWSQSAGIYLRSDDPARALALLLQGVEAEPGNPIHHFLAGTALARLERYEEADRSFVEAERIYPAYELDVEPQRESAWATAFNTGAAAYAEGEVETAMDAWRGAIAIFGLRAEAHRNLAMLLQEEGRYDEAVTAYQQALEGLSRRPATRILREEEHRSRDSIRVETEAVLTELLLITDRFAEAEPYLQRQLEAEPDNLRVQQNLALALGALGREEEAAILHAALLAEGTLETAQLFNLGVALFRASDFTAAAEAFGRLTERRPYSREAWFNYTNALFAAEDWGQLATAAERLLELDPLNENSSLIAARAHLEGGDEERAIAGVRRIEAAPVHLDGLILRSVPGGITLQGRAVGNKANPGTPVWLRFTFFDDRDVVGSQLLTVTAPAPGEATPLELRFRGEASGWRYEVVGGS